MRQTYLLLSALLLLSTSCMIGVQGNGRVEEQKRQIESFESISVSGMFEVYVRQGNSNTLRLVADENLHELIETRVEGDRLYISTKETIGKAKELDVYLMVENLKAIDASGAISLKSEGEIESRDLRIESSGAAEIDLEVDVDDLIVETSGAAEIEMAGKADRLRVETSGAAELSLFELEVNNCSVNTSGAAEVRVTVKDVLSVDASGAADIRYRGNPELKRTDLSGAASLKKD